MCKHKFGEHEPSVKQIIFYSSRFIDFVVTYLESVFVVVVVVVVVALYNLQYCASCCFVFHLHLLIFIPWEWKILHLSVSWGCYFSLYCTLYSTTWWTAPGQLRLAFSARSSRCGETYPKYRLEAYDMEQFQHSIDLAEWSVSQCAAHINCGAWLTTPDSRDLWKIHRQCTMQPIAAHCQWIQ